MSYPDNDRSAESILHRIFLPKPIEQHRTMEEQYDEMYVLWHTTELSFWTPLVGEREAKRFGYSSVKRAWHRTWWGHTPFRFRPDPGPSEPFLEMT